MKDACYVNSTSQPTSAIAQAQREPQVFRQTELLYNSIRRVDELIEILHGRLHPIIMDQLTAGKEEGAPVPVLAPHANTLRELTYAVEQQEKRLSLILNTIEI